LVRWRSVLDVQGDLGEFPAAIGADAFVIDGAVDGCGDGEGYGGVPDRCVVGHLLGIRNLYFILPRSIAASFGTRWRTRLLLQE